MKHNIFLMKSYIFWIALFFIIILTACSQQQPAPPQDQQLPSTSPQQQCANYTRNGMATQYCAVCGNNICEPFESCTASECTVEGCTRDCGPLYCEDDCKQNQQPTLSPGTFPEMTASLRTCRYDADCVKVKADCCGCTMGGQAATLNKENEAVWTKTVEVKCKNIACLQVISNHWTCFADTKCINNKCTLVNE